MRCCERNIHGEIIARTCRLLAVDLIIDSSGTMGNYLPEDVEKATNAFFRTIGAYKDTDSLVELCVYESHDETEVLGGFGRASSFTLSNLRYGGNWNLPSSLAQAIDDLVDYSNLLDRHGYVCALPVLVVISDNPIHEDSLQFQNLLISTENAESYFGRVPHCLFVNSNGKNTFEQYLASSEFLQTDKDALTTRLVEIANYIASIVRPHPIQPYSPSGA